MTAFDLDRFLSLPRVAGLALSPDGSRLVTSVATVTPDGKRFQTALWQLDPAGAAAPRRLTRSAKGESSAAGAFSDLCPSPDGKTVYALRSTMEAPAEGVALAAGAADQDPVGLATPGLPVSVPGRLEEMVATAGDGTPVHSWIVLPQEA